jgi:hypothetical protein
MKEELVPLLLDTICIAYAELSRQHFGCDVAEFAEHEQATSNAPPQSAIEPNRTK